jgi:hypothetical protein
VAYQKTKSRGAQKPPDTENPCTIEFQRFLNQQSDHVYRFDNIENNGIGRQPFNFFADLHDQCRVIFIQVITVLIRSPDASRGKDYHIAVPNISDIAAARDLRIIAADRSRFGYVKRLPIRKALFDIYQSYRSRAVFCNKKGAVGAHIPASDDTDSFHGILNT